jgi:hypothetical protein
MSRGRSWVIEEFRSERLRCGSTGSKNKGRRKVEPTEFCGQQGPHFFQLESLSLIAGLVGLNVYFLVTSHPPKCFLSL